MARTDSSPPGEAGGEDGQHSHRVNDALEVPKRLVVLIVVSLFVVLSGLVWLTLEDRRRLDEARQQTIEARDLAADNAELVEDGIRCLVTNQYRALDNQEELADGGETLEGPFTTDACVRFQPRDDG